MSDWTFAQTQPSDELAQLHFFSIKKRQPDGDVEFVITVKDSGTWRSSSPDTTSGRGMPIMRGLMDRVEINTAHGTEVRMCRRLGGTKHDE